MTNSSRIALATGATRGLGLETVRQLAAAGVPPLLARPDPERTVAAALKLQGEGLPVEAIDLDVTDAASIQAAAERVRARHGRLDILVNNAAIILDDLARKPSEQPLDAWRATFDTNEFALVAVTHAFLPLLRASISARIVNVSSSLASIALFLDPASITHGFPAAAYNTSKTAVNAWTVQLAHELRDTRIKVNAIDPGYVKTEMNVFDGVQHGDLDVAVGARTSVRLALVGDDGPNGGYFHVDKVLPW